jgi:hypothetical protein
VNICPGAVLAILIGFVLGFASCKIGFLAALQLFGKKSTYFFLLCDKRASFS